MDNHNKGLINFQASTRFGQTIGKAAQKTLRMFIKENWSGLLAHVAQETADRFIEAGQELFIRLSASCKPKEWIKNLEK